MGAPPKLFFVHLMKTGGASFRAMLRTVIAPERIYPSSEDADDDLLLANIDIDRLVHLPADRRARLDAYAGHFPFIAAELIADPVWTATIIRDPLSRTISFLKHCRRYDPRFDGWELEAIYDDEMTFEMLIHDYQTKLFAMTTADRLESQLDPIRIDEERLDLACRNLAKVDVVGTHDRYDDFVTLMSERTGWSFDRVGRWRTGEPDPVDERLKDRIVADNVMDQRFFESACHLVEQRAAERAEGPLPSPG
jgi:hypothetical protein